MKINLLSPLLANQIAAGEVVERPASVVKELIENGLDAGSTCLEIRIKEGGKKLIQIRDNGEGIDKGDLILAVSRHATSKIKDLADLCAIRSLGFRGEALASISSVAQLTLYSKTKTAELAWQISVNGTELKPVITPSSHPNGTTISIKDLFFNMPARKKFLRTAQTELAHIDEIIKRIALSRFDVTINVFSEDMPFRQYPLATTTFQKEKRVTKIFGQRFMQQANFLDISSTSLRMWGWLGLAEFSRQQSDLQYFYVNGRVIRDRLLNHAVRQAFEDRLPVGRYPAYVLYLEIDPREVDVNVHPTKHEVRFHESRLVHDFIVSSLKKALTREAVYEDNATEQLSLGAEFSVPLQQHENSANTITKPYRSLAQTGEKYFAFASQALNAKQQQDEVLSDATLFPSGHHCEHSATTPFDASRKHIAELPHDTCNNGHTEKTTQNLLQLVGITHNQFAIYNVTDGIAIVATSSLCRHYLCEEWFIQWQENSCLAKQLLLIPRQLPLSTEQIDFFVMQSESFKKLGIEYNALGPERMILRSITKGLIQIDLDKLFVQLRKVKINFDAFEEEIAQIFILLAQTGEVEQKAKERWLASVDEKLLNSLSPVFVGLAR